MITNFKQYLIKKFAPDGKVSLAERLRRSIVDRDIINVSSDSTPRYVQAYDSYLEASQELEKDKRST